MQRAESAIWSLEDMRSLRRAEARQSREEPTIDAAAGSG